MKDHYFTIDKAWLANLSRAFISLQHRKVNLDMSSINIDELQEQSNYLYEGVWNRLQNHISTSGTEDHYCWEFLTYNLSRICAHLVFGGYTIKKLKQHAKHSHKQLLSGHDTMILLMDKECEYKNKNYGMTGGTYLVYKADEPNCIVPIRTGKTDKPHHERIDTHYKACKLTTAASLKSKFYTTYPRRDAQHLDKFPDIECHFEELIFTCLTGYNAKLDNACLITSYDDDGLFVWTPAVKNSCRNKTASEKKFKHEMMINYSYEAVSQFMLDPNMNISESKGFEEFLAYHNKNKK